MKKTTTKAKSKVKKKEVKAPVGRPSKYSKKLLDKANDYLKNWEKKGNEIPSNCSLCLHLGITRDCIQKWKNDPDKPEFLYILAQISMIQETTLVNKGLNSDFNSNICKLMLTKHGYSDKQEMTGTEGGPLEVTINNHLHEADVDHGDGENE